MKKNMKKWAEEILEKERKKAFPILSFPSIQKMGISVRDLISSSELQAQGMKIIADSADVLASVSLMDLSVEAECFGSTIRFSDDEVPTVIGSVIRSEEEAENLVVPEIGAGRTGIYIDAIRKAAELITDRPVFAGVIGPFSLTGRLLDVSEAMIYCYEEPDMVHIVLEKVTEFLIKYIRAYQEAGADGVLIAEPLAGLLSPDLAAEFSAEYVGRIIRECQTDEFMMAYHNCGNSTIPQMESIVGTGAALLHFGNAVEMEKVTELVPGHILVAGNVDPAGQFRNGTVESIRRETLEIMQKCCRHKNFIISSGCDIPPLSNWDNIQAFFDAVEEYYDTVLQD